MWSETLCPLLSSPEYSGLGVRGLPEAQTFGADEAGAGRGGGVL